MKNLAKVTIGVFTVLNIIILNPQGVDAKEYVDIEVIDKDYVLEQTASEDLSGDSENGSMFSDKYLSETNDVYSGKYFENQPYLTNATKVYPSRILGVPNYQQQNGYYCGPANVKQVLQYINDWSDSQDTYAISMGTNSDGTYVYAIRDELNYRQSYTNYNYYLMSDGNFTLFRRIIEDKIFHGKDTNSKGIPVILHANTASLYMYNGVSLGHYLTVNGYDDNSMDITYVDTWAADYGRGTTLGQHTDNVRNMFNTVVGRYVIA